METQVPDSGWSTGSLGILDAVITGFLQVFQDELGPEERADLHGRLDEIDEILQDRAE